MNVALVLAIPFLGTVLGSGMVFLMKNKMNGKVEKLLLGFASGVMIAASVWSLLIPSIDMAREQGDVEWIPAAIGFLLGIVFLLVLDSLIPHLHLNTEKPEGLKAKLKKEIMLVLAVTLHNIPEGMAVGVLFSACLSKSPSVTLAGALMLAFGIAVQNFPEGAVISMPLRADGMKRNKSFLFGVMSGITEPIAAGITILFSGIITPLLPYLLSFAAGAMIYVVVDRLIPESASLGKSLPPSVVFCLGFTMMMALDVALG